jgi:hypothetical protein
MLRTALSATLCVSILPSVLVPAAYGQQRTTQGAAVGGATGAIIGGIIGHQNDETPEGALIGGAVGAIAGGLLGRSQDNQIARERYNRQQAYNHGRYVQQQTVMASGVSMSDVISMSRSGLSEQLIISHVNSKGVQRRLEVSEIITMHQQGVSDYVISAMQSAPLASQVAPPYPVQQIVTQPSTVIVREQPVYYSRPVVTETYYHPAPVYHGHQHYYAPRSRF